MVKRVVVWCCLVLVSTVADETPPFKPLVSGVDLALRWYTPRDARDTSLLHHVQDVLSQWDNVNITRGVTLNRIINKGDYGDATATMFDAMLRFIKQYVVRVRLLDVADAFDGSSNDLMTTSRSIGRFFGGGKNSFLTGFVLGVVAFGLKKLMLPFIIGAQIFKSVLLALFLPSIIGGLGKIVSKGVSNFAAGSGGLGGLSGGGGQMDDFDFKDQAGYSSQVSDAQADGSSSLFSYAYPNSPYDSTPLSKFTDPSNIGVLPAPYPAASNSITNRYTQAQKVSYLPNSNHHGSFYTKNSFKNANKQQDYKVFHNIPSSSMLLTNYDPFYSALLSRMDSVFQQLSYTTEPCRERLVCMMYRNPAKFAPYSNLISAQLSRELNELRKPSTDNPEILRFFKYMKAAKDGQDGHDCMRVYPDCYDSRETTHPPMVQTYNDINKLVHARKL